MNNLRRPIPRQWWLSLGAALALAWPGIPGALAQEGGTPEPERPAAGEEPPAPDRAPPVVPEAPAGIEAIEITGERMDATNVQDEAKAVTAFDMTALDRANITNVDGLDYNVPSLHVGQQGNQAIITLRGIGTQNASITGEPGVQFHVDGLNYARPAAARVAFFDIESLRVVRGPHGTNGGKNATGGAIHLITRKPTDEFGFEADYQVGDYDLQRWRGAINVPLLPERAAARFAFISEEHDGYQINLTDPDQDKRADDADNFGLRSHLKFNPTDNFEALLSYNYYRAKGVGPGAKLVATPHTVRCLAPSSAQTEITNLKRLRGIKEVPPGLRDPTPAERQRFNLQQYTDEFGRVKTEQVVLYTDNTYYRRLFVNDRDEITRHTDKAWCADLNSNRVSNVPPSQDPDDPRKVYLDMVQQQSNSIWGWGTTLNWDLPALPLLGETRLVSLTGFENTSLSDPRDFDTTDLPFFSLTQVENESLQYSSELRLESSDRENVDWVGGLYFQREKSTLFIDGRTFGTAFGLGIDQDATVKSYGAYGEANWHLTDSVTLRTGARFTQDYKDTWLFRAAGSGFSEAGAPAEASCLSTKEWNDLRGLLNANGTPLRDGAPHCNDRWSHWTGGVGLEWRPRDQHLLYAQYDTGFKAGGYIVADFGKYDPETIDAYTIGSKSQFFDGRLQLNLEGFLYYYHDYQVVEIDGLSLRTENAPEARVFGLESEFDIQPVAGLRVNGQAAYLNTEFTEFESVDPMTGLGQAFRDGLLTPDQLQDLSGNELARSPKFSYTVGVEYAFPVGRFGSLTPRVQYYWQDEAWYRAFNTRFDYQEKYHKTDIKLIWNSPEEHWSAEVFVENLEDNDVFQNLVIGSGAIGSPALAYYSAPRLWGFRVGFRY
jgi:outer membrane receptor protein involved in Fe transport